MDYEQVRKGVSQAEFNSSVAGWVYLEIILASILIGGVMKSWIIFGVLLIGMITMMAFRKSALLLCILFTLYWTYMSSFLFFDLFGLSAAIVMGLITAMIVGGIHMAAIEWTEDMS